MVVGYTTIHPDTRQLRLELDRHRRDRRERRAIGSPGCCLIGCPCVVVEAASVVVFLAFPGTAGQAVVPIGD